MGLLKCCSTCRSRIWTELVIAQVPATLTIETSQLPLKVYAPDGRIISFLVALFGQAIGDCVEGIEPGLYHYSPKEFALRKLRGGAETLARLTRGRPDLAFLKTVPLAMLVSTIYCRATWRFGRRG